MELRLIRNSVESGPGYTHGRLLVDECGFFCWTLEDTDRGLRQDTPLEEIARIKVKGQTAIPAGRYRVRFRVSPKFKTRPWAEPQGGKVAYLCDVPGFSGVCVHPGNTPEDTDGCLLVGMLHSGIRGRIFDSQATYKDLMKFYLWPAYLRGDDIWLTIE